LGRGVIYDRHHVAAGFWKRWSGRALWPVQLVEAAASAALVVLALSCATTPGTAALIYIVGYSAVRFSLELLRGDVLRPYALGLSEAQWVSLGTALACLVWRPGLMIVIVASTLLTTAIVLVALRGRRAMTSPPHLRELDRVLAEAHDGKRHSTSRGVAVSRNVLPDGRVDWILSAPGLTEATARKLAHLMWPRWELVPARTPEMVHILTQDGA
jgi:hypothetical protein